MRQIKYQGNNNAIYKWVTEVNSFQKRWGGRRWGGGKRGRGGRRGRREG